MYIVISGKKYQKQLKKISKQSNFDLGALHETIELLKCGQRLPKTYRDYQLKGAISTYHECHIKHDMLLVYCKNEQELLLLLVTVGTHSNLFEK